jgi:hypothetical protein
MDKEKVSSTLSEEKKDVEIANKETKVKKKKTGLVILVIFLGVVFVGLSGYIVFSEFINQPEEISVDENEQEDQNEDNITVAEEDEDQEENEEEDTQEDDDKDTLTTFEGEVVTADLPEGWSIIEYFDGEGTDSLPGPAMEYEGLTALDIISPDNRQVFTLQAVSGIGFMGCPDYALFEDNNESYQMMHQNTNDEIGEEMNIIDYTDTEYVEFDWLDVTFRRIDDTYYYDTDEGNNYFEPPCFEGILTLEGLFFTDQDGYIYESYFYGPTEDSTLADLTVVDSILASMEIN